MTAGRFGAHLTKAGATFRLWAPAARTVDVVLDRPYPMRRKADGWFVADIAGIGAGALYKYRIDGEIEVPDPASRFQPHDISGPSEIIDHGTYRWRAADWRGRPWHDAVFVEAHVGTFTPQGSYRAMIDRLDHLVATGFTALELMPLADFPGARNWGYDGVLWYAPDSAYGRPDELKALIDEAHLRGLMVFLDVVYNHFGPEGNYLGRYAPAFFADAHTPWGVAIDYRVKQVRQYAIESALHWLADYRFDGLRLDAVQAITEPGEIPVLHDLSAAVGTLAKATGRAIHLVLENDDNRAVLLDPLTEKPAGKYRAQWNDDYHHAFHALLTGEAGGYYRDYPNPRQSIARALGSGFAYQGEASAHRNGRRRGEPSSELPPAAFVNFLQNHDQIGNRPLGERIDAIAAPQAIEAALAITLLAPMPPLLFMGEEWGATVPFLFFCDFKGDLAHAIREGRRREFKDAYEQYGDDIPDPLTEATFEQTKLDWTALRTPEAGTRLALVRRLLSIRRAEIVPALQHARFGNATLHDERHLSANWPLGEHGTLCLAANLSDSAVTPAPADASGVERLIFGQRGDDGKPWGVVWSIIPASGAR